MSPKMKKRKSNLLLSDKFMSFPMVCSKEHLRPLKISVLFKGTSYTSKKK